MQAIFGEIGLHVQVLRANLVVCSRGVFRTFTLAGRIRLQRSVGCAPTISTPPRPCGAARDIALVDRKELYEHATPSQPSPPHLPTPDLWAHPRHGRQRAGEAPTGAGRIDDDRR